MKAKISKCVWYPAVSKSQPLEHSTLPPSPWHTTEIDFHTILTPIFTLSVVQIVSSKSANCSISVLEKIFSEHGPPQRIISDNRPPFKSSQIFLHIWKILEFNHNHITPLHPRANEIVETFMCHLSKILRITNMQKRNWK